MRKIKRPNKPLCFNIDTLENYKALKDKNGKIRSRWNYQNKKNNEFKAFFIKAFNSECAYCGKRVDEIEIDHYLPTSKFPYLAYCYDNFILSCSKCNQKLKRDFYPPSLESKNYGEKILVNEISGIEEYDKVSILSKTKDRIIEPTFDYIESHLEFDVLTCEYRIISNSEIGVNTNSKFFNKNFTEELQKLSKSIFKSIQENIPKEIIFDLLSFSGKSFYYEKIYDFWFDFYKNK